MFFKGLEVTIQRAKGMVCQHKIIYCLFVVALKRLPVLENCQISIMLPIRFPLFVLCNKFSSNLPTGPILFQQSGFPNILATRHLCRKCVIKCQYKVVLRIVCINTPSSPPPWGTKLKNSNCDKIQKLKMLQTQLVTKLKW